MAFGGTPTRKLVSVSRMRSARLAPRGRSLMTSSAPIASAITCAPKPRLWLSGLSE